jgi:2-methylcitrate dehydratase PrpD
VDEPRVSAPLSRFVAESRWEDLPAPIRREARRGVLNFAGCMLGAREEPEIAILRDTFPNDPALVDAAAATAFDYDDTHQRTVIHATPPVGGAVFALAREQAVSGPELLHAFALGVEVSCRMGNAVMPGHYEHGWHITSTCGIFGAAVAAAKILKLDEDQILSSLGIAATQSSGLVEMLGSMARVLNAGFAARNGLNAARLAQQGFRGPALPLEGRRGFLNVFGGAGDTRWLTDDLGKHWEMTQVSYKPYPCGVVIHALIDACLELRRKGTTFETITVALHPLAIERTDRPEPRDSLIARLSAQHAVAVTLLRGRAGLAEFSDAAAKDPQIDAFRRRVKLVADDKLDKMECVVSDGKASIRLAAARPMDDARLEAKFREQAGGQADRWLRFVDSLESADKVSFPS